MKEIDWSKAPHGATHYSKGHAYPWMMEMDGVVYRYVLDAWVSITPQELGKQRIREAILREADSTQDWTGEGLPPVGTVCEVANPDQIDEWCECTVLAHDGPLAVFRANGDYPWLYDGTQAGNFRPIRTPEQIAAEERLHNVRNACTAIADTLDSLRGKTKVERAALAVVEAMIDAGYAKVTP